MVLWARTEEMYSIKAYHIKQIRFNKNPVNINDINKEPEKNTNDEHPQVKSDADKVDTVRPKKEQ